MGGKNFRGKYLEPERVKVCITGRILAWTMTCTSGGLLFEENTGNIGFMDRMVPGMEGPVTRSIFVQFGQPTFINQIPVILQV